MKKQLLLFVMMLLPMVASADPVEIDGIYYNLIKKTKTAEVTSNPNKYSGAVDIPPSVTYEDETYRVTSFDSYAFSKCSGLTTITIPNSVTSIGSHAFEWCSGLTTISVPNSLISIEEYTFRGCDRLTSISIPNNLTYIGSSAFQGCSSLTSFTIPNNVTNIAGNCFADCSGLTSITIPKSVNQIHHYAFYGCSGLTSVHISDIDSWCKINFIGLSNPLIYAHHLFLNGSELSELVIPNSVTFIRDSAFNGCSGLTSITIPHSVTSIGNNAFYGCSGITSITIPHSVTSIGNYAFYECSKLETINIGYRIQTIGNSSFGSCPELTDVYCYAESVPSIWGTTFMNSYIEYCTLHVPEASINAYKATETWKDFKNFVAVPPMCTTPTIKLIGGNIHFECETEKVEYHYEFTASESGKGTGNDISITPTYAVKVYASKPGYTDSEEVSLDINAAGVKGDVNQDGEVTITDAVSVVNIILEGGAAAPALKELEEIDSEANPE